MSIAKNFEKNVSEQIRRIKDSYVYRLSDLVNKFGVSNPCDYFCFYRDTFYMLEMKTTEASSLPLKNISDYQYASMLEASRKRGIKAFFIVWWYSKDVTRAIPVSVISDIMETKKKSIRYDYADSRIIEIGGFKRKFYYEYDWGKFFKECSHGDKRGTSAKGRNRFRSHRKCCGKNRRVSNKGTRRVCKKH